jgi:hypothetical protein
VQVHIVNDKIALVVMIACMEMTVVFYSFGRYCTLLYVHWFLQLDIYQIIHSNQGLFEEH